MRTTNAKVAGAFDLTISDVGKIPVITDRGTIGVGSSGSTVSLWLKAQIVLDFSNQSFVNADLAVGMFDLCTKLAHLDLSYNSFTTIPAALFDKCTSLIDLAINNCALTAAGVNFVLASLVVATATGGVLLINGGTNAAPIGQGITDAATLVSRGWTVTTT
jgi:hypothetical protein